MEYLIGGGWGHVGVAVPVATHPGAEPDGDPVGRKGRADRLEDSLQFVEQLGYRLANCLGQVVDDKAGLVEGVGSDVAQFVGLPDRLNQLVDPAVETASVGLGATGVAPFLDQFGDAGHLVEDRRTGCLGGVGGEHRSEFGATNQLGDLVWPDAPLDQCRDGFFELVGYVWGPGVEVLDPVNLFGHVGQVEVHRKGSDEQVGLNRVGVVEQLGQPPGHRVAGVEGAEVSGERSDPFDCVE